MGCALNRNDVTTPKLPPPPPHGPEEVRVLLGGRADETSVGQHHFHRKQIVDREAALTRQMTEAAAEREAANAGRRDNARGDGQAERVRRVVHVAPQRAAARPHRPPLRVHADVPHRRQINHQTVVAHPESGRVVPASTDGHAQLVVAAEIHRGDDIGHVHTASDQTRSTVDHGVVDFASLVVARIARFDESSAQTGLKGGNGRFIQHDASDQAFRKE